MYGLIIPIELATSMVFFRHGKDFMQLRHKNKAPCNIFIDSRESSILLIRLKSKISTGLKGNQRTRLMPLSGRFLMFRTVFALNVNMALKSTFSEW